MTQAADRVAEASRRRSWANAGLWILLGVCLATAVVSRLAFLAEPFQRDAGLYICMGRLVAEGGVLYRDLFETKFPTVGAMVAPFWMAFGAHWWGYVLIQMVAAIGAAIALGWAAGRFVGRYALWPTLLFALVYFNFSRIVLTGFQLETLMVVFAAIGACFALWTLRSDRGSGGVGAALAVGICAGLAAMAKPTGLAVAGALAIGLLWRIRTIGWRLFLLQLAALTVGGALVIGANLLWIVNSAMWPYMPEVFRQIRLYGSETPWEMMLAIKVPIFIGLPLLPLAVRALARWHPWGRLGAKTSSPAAIERMEGGNPGALWAFAVAWFILELIGVLIQKRPYSYHFLTLAPPAALLFGMFPFRPRFWPIALGLAPVILLSLYFSVPGLPHLGRGFRQAPVSRYISAHTDPQDRVWGDYNTRLLLETGLRSGSRILFTFNFVNSDDAPGLFGGMLLSDFRSWRPKYIVLSGVQDQAIAATAHGGLLSRLPLRRERYLAEWNKIKTYIHQHYALEATVDGHEIYRRSATSLPR